MNFSSTESTYSFREPGGLVRRDSRREGIALMVVMIVFIVLYMMVYHLSYYTMMEEKIADVRRGDIQGQDALYSVAQLVMAQLTEDIIQDYSGGGAEESAPAAAGAAAGGGGDPGGGRGEAGAGAGRFVSLQTGPQGGVGTGGGGQSYDYLMEAIFNSQEQEVGGERDKVRVKVTVIDNERRFDLNRLFEYAPLPDEEDALSGPGGTLTGEELAEMAAGTSADTEQGKKSLSEQIRSRVGLINRGDDSSEGGEEANELENVAGLEDETELTEFVEPTQEQQEATVLMLGRAIEVILSLNEDREFYYNETYNSDRLARDITEYVLDRRTSPQQNRIYDVGELMNIHSITRELFYGPRPAEIPEEGIETARGFLLEKDDFGDLRSTYILNSDQELFREEEELGLQELKESFPGILPPELIAMHGQNFPGIGGLNANSLTQGMTGPAQAFDEEGYEYIEQPDMPVGLREIFTTFSIGKININTTSIPILYALLPSLKEGNDEEAESVALLINDYRFEFQQFQDEEGVEPIDGADAPVKDLGQPRRPLPPEEEELDAELDINSLVPMDQLGMSGAGTPMADVETNYFTNLEQIELVDGTAGDAEDLLTSEVGVDRIDSGDDPLLQRVLNDYRNVMCFAGTYFTIELKAKSEKSPLVKSGIMIIKRDAQEKRMEVILWKELQD